MWRATVARVMLGGLLRRVGSSSASLTEATQQQRLGAAAENRYKQLIKDAFWQYAFQFQPRFEQSSYAGHIILNIKSAISQYLPEAWYAGFAAAGIKRDEVSVDELAAIQAFTAEQRMYADLLADQLGDAVRRYGRARQGDPKRTAEELAMGRRVVMGHVPLWQNAWDSARNQAIAMARTNPKMMWSMGPTAEHCWDCLRYHGRVYRAATWHRYDIEPQSRSLSCHGYRCQCRFLVTDEPLTPGRPPAMTGG